MATDNQKLKCYYNNTKFDYEKPKGGLGVYNTLAELKTQEFENIEKTYNDISSKLRDIGEIRFYKVFGVAYLAYLAKVNKLETAKELSDYVAEH